MQKDKSTIELSRFPNRPFPYEDESLEGYLYRFFARNGHTMPLQVKTYLRYIAEHVCSQSANALTKLADGMPVDTLIARTVHQYRVIRQKSPSVGYQSPGYRAYCPLCMRDQAYHRYLWQFSLMTACPRHECQLLKTCPDCKRSLTFSQLLPNWTCYCKRPISSMVAPPASQRQLQISSLISGQRRHPADASETPAEEAMYELMEWAVTVRRILKGNYVRTPYWIDEDKIREEMSLFFRGQKLECQNPEAVIGGLPLVEMHRNYVYAHLEDGKRVSCQKAGNWDLVLMASPHKLGIRFFRLIRFLERKNPHVLIDLTASPKIQLLYFATRKLIPGLGAFFRAIQLSITSALNKYALSDMLTPLVLNPGAEDSCLVKRYDKLNRWWAHLEASLNFVPRREISLVHDLGMVPEGSDYPLPSTSYLNLVERIEALAHHPDNESIVARIFRQWNFPDQMKGKISLSTLLVYLRLMPPVEQRRITRLVDQETALR